jgi:hypothetical protein
MNDVRFCMKLLGLLIDNTRSVGFITKQDDDDNDDDNDNERNDNHDKK